MDLSPTPEQEAITDSTRALLHAARAYRREDRGHGGVDHGFWKQCDDLGWFALGLPDDKGGVGYSTVEESLVFVEIGRALPSGPFLATVLGARLASDAGCSAEVKAILAGDALVALAEPRTMELGAGREISGTFDVFDGREAAMVLVVTASGAWLLDAAALPILHDIECIDASVQLGEMRLSAVRAIAYVPAAQDVLHRQGTILAAATLAGIAGATRDAASSYAREREQFGRPIGVNQAIKHRCADMAVRAEAAHAQVMYAAVSHSTNRFDAPFQASSAKVVATDAARQNSADNVQVHGAIGYTFEHDAHRFVTRTQVLDRMLGDRRSHLATILNEPNPLERF
jgi:alkylation response protein AidB-like acyl-CoA dehydrogenase